MYKLHAYSIWIIRRCVIVKKHVWLDQFQLCNEFDSHHGIHTSCYMSRQSYAQNVIFHPCDISNLRVGSHNTYNTFKVLQTKSGSFLFLITRNLLLWHFEVKDLDLNPMSFVIFPYSTVLQAHLPNCDHHNSKEKELHILFYFLFLNFFCSHTSTLTNSLKYFWQESTLLASRSLLIKINHIPCFCNIFYDTFSSSSF